MKKITLVSAMILEARVKTHNSPPRVNLNPNILENTESTSSADCAVPSERRPKAPFTMA